VEDHVRDELGPAAERCLPHVSDDAFDAVIGALAEGALLYPAPFDPASSAVLADIQGPVGPRAWDFEGLRATVPTAYDIRITAVAGTQRRDVVRTQVPVIEQLLALVRALIAEHHTQEASKT
jgi:hypothetical protein